MIGLLLAALAEAATVRHAVVVGANDGGGVLEPLQYAERDAETVGHLLVELGGFDEALVTVLYSPTREDLRLALASHAAVAAGYDDDLFVFYYSGHADGTGLRLATDEYWFETLKHDLRAVDSDVRIGILDACRSGAITRLKGADVGPSMFEDMTPTEGEAWLTAASADEIAQESDQLRSGFFTHYLVSGMRGAADTGDGVVDLSELYRYTFDRVVAQTGSTTAGAQHPSFDYQLSGSGDVAITDLRNASALIVLPADASGQIAILRLPDQLQIAELAKLPGQELKIAVPEGRYLVRRRFEGELYDVTVGIRDGAVLRVEDWGAPRGMEDAFPKGDEVLVFAAESIAFERGLDLDDSPVIAGVASLVIPGAGQFYNGEPWKGAAFFGGTAALMAGTMFGDKDVNPGAWPLMGTALWGASIADAAYRVRRNEEVRPYEGGTVQWSGAFGGKSWPYHVGLSGDVIVRKGLSLGLDRVGYTRLADGGWDTAFGSRMMVAWDGKRWRPGAFVGFGLRHGRSNAVDPIVTRAVFGSGVDVRYYVVPRYFLDVDLRWEKDGDDDAVVTGLGFGVHLGR